MKRSSVLISSVAVVVFGVAGIAQAPTSQTDAHVAAARAAAGRDFRVILSNHSEFDGAYTKARLIAAPRQVGETPPFIVGAAGVQRYFTVMRECATASRPRNNTK